MQDYKYRIRVYTKAGDEYVSVTLTITSTKLLSSNFKDLHKALSRTLYTSDFVIYEITSIVPFYADKRALELLVLVMVLAYLLSLLIK